MLKVAQKLLKVAKMGVPNGYFLSLLLPTTTVLTYCFQPPDFRGENTYFGGHFGSKTPIFRVSGPILGVQTIDFGVQNMILGPRGVQSCPKGAQSMVPQAHFGSRGVYPDPPKPRF